MNNNNNSKVVNPISTPVAPSTGKAKLLGEQNDHDFGKMQTAAANVAPHRLG